MKKFLFLVLLCFLYGCAGKTGQESGAAVPPPDCPKLFVILPGNYIIDVAAGSEVILNPDFHEFAAFCDAKNAFDALELAKKENRLPAGEDWRVYTLAGNGAELVKQCNGDNLCLGQQATVEGWLDPDDGKAF